MPKRPLPMLMYVDNPDDGGGTPPAPSGEPEVKTFTQDEVNALLAKQKREHRSEVAGLQSKVDEGKTLEQRLAEVEQRAAKAEAQAMRSDIAAKFGINAEDRDLFLTGADEDTLTAQAQRLAAREADRKKQGNVAPKEGGNPNPGDSGSDMRAFTRQLFQRAVD